MDTLRIKHSLLYLFRCENWFSKMLILLALLFLPFIGWLAITGFFVRITKNWINQDYNSLPEFSDFGELILLGLITIIVFLVYTIPQMILGFIPCFGSILSMAYSVILVLISPYLLSVIATEGTFSGKLFNFSLIAEFVQENILNLLIFLAVIFVIGFCFLLILIPFVAVGIIMIAAAEKSDISFMPAIAVFIFVTFFAIIIGYWSSSVSYALSGNIFDIWRRRRGTNKTQPSVSPPTQFIPPNPPVKIP